MENELVKNLCAKYGFKQAAAVLINNIDIEAFQALVEKSETLYDFVIQNVIKKLEEAITPKNYRNITEFLKIYSEYYEDLFVSALKKYGDEQTEQILLDKLYNGTDDEKAYCVKYFEENKELTPVFREYSKSEFEPLAFNAAHALGIVRDEESFNEAVNDLNSDDEFKVLSATKFLTSYGDKKALPFMLEALKTSPMAENIACEILYLEDIFELLEEYPKEALILINEIISGLGEIIPISAVYELRLYDLIENISSPLTLLHIKQKIDQLTENDEYLFDEDKDLKNEIYAIKDLLYSKTQEYWESLTDMITLDEDLLFYALELIRELELDYSQEIKEIINTTNNPTVLLKCVEVLETLDKLAEVTCEEILQKVEDNTIKTIIKSIFES